MSMLVHKNRKVAETVNMQNMGIFTQEEFDALPEEVRNKGVYFVDDGNSGGSDGSGGSSMEVYDGEERVIGTWFGKPLYRKAYSVITPSSTGQISLGIDTSELNVSTLIRLDAILQGSVASANNKYNVDVFFSASKLIYANIDDRNYTSQPIVIILEYTKTTDEEATAE